MKRIVSVVALAMTPYIALGADAGALGCKTTEESARVKVVVASFMRPTVEYGEHPNASSRWSRVLG